MALTYNDPAVIKLISQKVNLIEELTYLIQENEVDMFERAVGNIDLSHQEGVGLLKLCLENSCDPIARALCTSVIDIKKLFTEVLQEGDLSLSIRLMDLSEELSLEYVAGLAQQNQQQGLETLFSQFLEIGDGQETGQTAEEVVIGQIQIDNE
jgi:hypothetical protein